MVKYTKAKKQGCEVEAERSSPAKRAKELGCKSLNSVSEVSTVSVLTLRNWSKNKPVLFDLVCEAVAVKVAGSGV